MEFKSTDELLEKIMREDYTRFNKSTMVIKLEN